MPVEPDRVAQLLERRLLVAHGGAGRLSAAGPDGEGLAVSAARGVGDAAVRRELGADVGERDVVGRVLRLLPDEERPSGVGDELAAEVGANPFRALLQAYAAADAGWGLWCDGHEFLL